MKKTDKREIQQNIWTHIQIIKLHRKKKEEKEKDKEENKEG